MSMIKAGEPLPALSEEVWQEMDKYAITRVPIDSFRYRQFRYTNLQDALAQAKRDRDGRKRITA